MISLADIKPSVVTHKSNASNKDIRKVIDKMLPISAEQTQEIAAKFKGSSDAESARKVWNFLKNHITYHADGSEQIVKAPSALLRDKVGDCKSYTVFTSGVLTNLGIPHRIVYASYDKNDPEPGHVYVTTKDGVIIDAVWHKFNSEKKPFYRYEKIMNVRGITGTGTPMIGAVKDKFNSEKKPFYRYEKIMNVRGITGTGTPMIGAVKDKSSVKHAAALVTLASARNAFLAMVRLNIAGIASILNLKLAQAWDLNKGKAGTPEFVSNLFNTWYNIGGDPDALQKAITAGEAKKVSGIKILDEINKRSPALIAKYYAALEETLKFYLSRRGIDLREKKNQRTAGIGAEPAATTAAAAASIPVWLQVLQILSDTVIAVKSGAEQNQLKDEFLTDQERQQPDTSGGGFGFDSKMLLILGAAGLAAYAFTRKKSK